MRLVVHVDGGSRGNPGPAAAAAVVSAPDGRVLDETSVVLGRATNNVAEYRGLLLGLERARELGATEVDVVNDSELVANQVVGRYRVKSPELAPLHGEAMRALEGFERWSVKVVPRAQNAAADALVNRALDRADGGQPTPEAHDELLPTIVHQSSELWFKLILHELARARSELERDRPQAAIRPLQRTAAIERLLLGHLEVLETMGPEGLMELRDPLAPASDQLRAIESESPRLYDAFAACAGLPEGRDARLRALADLYRDHLDDPRRALLHQLAELLVDHDELIARWRHRHTLTAARAIGSRRSVEDPRGRRDTRFYPELWEVRSAL